MLKRKLGLTEYYSKFCHDHVGGTTLLSGMIRVQCPLSSNLAEKALHMMQKRHAVLRSYFTGSSRRAGDRYRDVLRDNLLKLLLDEGGGR